MDYYERMRLKPALFTLLLSLALGVHALNATPTEPKPVSSAMDSVLFYQLLIGELNARSDDPGVAFSLILDAARKTGDPAVYRRAVQIALEARAGESALQAAKAWSQAIPASAEANRFVLQILLGLNRTAETLEPLKRSLALTPAAERRDMLWNLPALFERTQDRQLAVATVQKALASVLSDKTVGATAWAVIGRFWLSAADKPAALNAATKGLAMDVNSEHAALLALSMLSTDVPHAEQLVRSHLPQARPAYHMAFIKALLDTQRTSEAQAELAQLKAHVPAYPDAWLVSGMLALQQQTPDVAEPQLLHYLDLVEALGPTDQPVELKRGRAQAQMSLAQIARLRHEPQTAKAWLALVDNPDDLLRAQIQQAVLMAQQGQLEEALVLLQNQPERNEADARLKRSAEIGLLRDFKHYARARDKLQVAIAQSPHDTDLVYELAMVSEKLGDLAEMERLLLSLIAANPQDPQPYNALGYSLADRNLRLDEAKALISKALSLAPGDPFITDSLAWAEFRSGNLAQALTLLQAAFKDKPDAEIAAHLGEVLWVSQRQAEARAVFTEGLKLNPDNETLVETLKRLRVAL